MSKSNPVLTMIGLDGLMIIFTLWVASLWTPFGAVGYTKQKSVMRRGPRERVSA